MSTGTRPKTGVERSSEPGGRRWDVLRVGMAATYLLGGLAHFALFARSPDSYERFADLALVGFYADAWRALVVPNLTVLVPLVGLFELGLGVALLWRGPAVRLGHAAGAVFQAGLVLSGPWGVVNAILAVVHAVAVRVPRGRSIPSLVRDRRWSA